MQQFSLFADNAEYDAFTAKFEPKKTTDDCYTPEGVYEAIADWVCREYDVTRERFLRPFWPGADYEAEEYPEGCVVVDNPPFSIVSKIVGWYVERGIKFFLFCPALRLIRNPSVTTVAVGDGADYSGLTRMAQTGDGRMYAAGPFDSLPRIFTKETMMISGSYVQNRVFTPAVTDPSMTDFPGFPERPYEGS